MVSTKKPAGKRLSSPLGLVRKTIALFDNYWKPLAGILGIFAVVNLIFGNGSSILSSVTSSLNDSATLQHSNYLARGLDGFSRIFGGSDISRTDTSAMPNFLLIIEVLITIWVTRQLISGSRPSIKDAYYRSMYPLVQFVLTLAVVVLQLLPIIIGSLIVVGVFADSPGLLDGTIFTAIFVLLAAWSVYMLSSSVFALTEVVTPDQTPLRSLRLASGLAEPHRRQIILRLLALPAMIFAAYLIILVPLIMITPWFVPLVFFTLAMATLPLVAAYICVLCEELKA